MNKVEIAKYLEKILESKTFSLSGVYKRLLEYLTEETLKGEKPKEFTIGHAVFKQEVDDPNSSRVRVSIHKLRKRLEKYYSSEGADDKIVFSIPKGGYTVEFKTKSSSAYKARTDITIKYKQLKKIGIGIVVIVSMILIYFILLKPNSSEYNKLKRTSFWNELINNDKKTIIVAGDFFVFRDIKSERENNRFLNIRDIQINNEEQLKQYIDSNNLDPNDFVALTDVTYMPRDALFSMQNIFPILYENKIDYQVILSSDFNWDTYKDYNIVYIGAFKNLKSLNILTMKLKVRYDNLDHVIYFNTGEKVNSYPSYFLENKNIDYTLVSKLPGANNNVIYLFVSDNDIGCIEATQRFTNYDSIKSFEKNILNDANYFKALYKAEGIIRTGITFDMIEYEPITDSTLSGFWHY